MKRMSWLVLVPLAVAVVLLAVGCGSGSEHVEEAEGGPHLVTPARSTPNNAEPAEPDDPVDGGVTDNSNPDAPKTIESTQIISFDCRFSTMDLDEPGSLGNHIYQLQAKLENGAVKGSYQVLDTGEERSFRESHSFLNEIQGLVAAYELAQYNGHDVSVAGLPEEYGARLDVKYASRESIYAYDNQDDFLSRGAMDALLRLFEQGAATLPSKLSLSVEEGFESEPLENGCGDVFYPIYRLYTEGYDALSAALASLNEMRMDGVSGEMDYFRSNGQGQLYYRTNAFVTRSDGEVVSFYERNERYESSAWEKPMTEYTAHRTGKELKFSDVFRDMEYLPSLILMEMERAYPQQTFYDEALDFIRTSIESNDGNISFALSYGCVHIFVNEYILNDEPGGQHITISYVLNPYQVKAFYTNPPQSWMIPLDDETTYWRTDISKCFRIKSWIGADTEDVIWEVMLDGKDEGAYVEPFYGYAPDCWLVQVSGRYFIYLRVPTGDVSMLTNIYEITERGVLKLTYEPLRMAIRTGSPLTPDGIYMNLDQMLFTPVGMILPYGTYKVDGSGKPVLTSDVYNLDGTWVILRESGRYNPDSRENAAISGGMWTLTAGERMKPYRTDMETFIDFITEDERVVRFEIDSFSEDMHLDNFGTLEDVFMPEGVG